MSKSVKKILTIAAAVAVAYFAPQVSAAIIKGGATGTAAAAKLAAASTATKVITTAAVNAAGNAALAAATGGDVKRAAITGALTGGFSGYTSAALYPSQVAATAPVAGVTAPSAGGGATGATAASGGAAGADALQEVVVTGLRTGGAGATAAGTVASTAGAAAGAGAAAPKKTFMETLREVPTAIADKFRDPATLADLTLRAAGMLAGSAAAGEGLSPDEQRLLQAQQEELNWLQKNNRAVFNQKLQEAQALLGEARYFDPEYFGLQAARRQQLAGAAQEREGLRGLTGERRRAAQRKIRLGVARNVGQAYDVGFGTGVSGRLQTRQAGLAALPEAPATYGGYSGLAATYQQARAGREANLGGIGDLFGALTGRRRAGLTGTEEEEDMRQRGIGG